jgi:osmoprotectant transport system permease protein
MRRLSPDPVLLPLVALLGAVPLWFAVVTVARNRLVSGRPMLLLDAAHGPAAIVELAGMALLVIATLSRLPLLAILASALVIGGLVWIAGDIAQAQVVTQPTARVSLGAGFWLMQALAALSLVEAARQTGRYGTALAITLLGAAAAALLMSGTLDALSILREYFNRRDVLGPALLRHIEIVAMAVLPTLLVGVPLGVGCYRRAGLGRLVLPILSVVQTIPSIALFGLMLAPLAALAAWQPALARAGISGVGMAPAVLALMLYSFLPIVSNTTAGLASVPEAVRDAARGIGMTNRQIFWQVETRLAFPALLAGLRITIVQAIGLAAVAALIGAGGLGAIMFDGLFTGALDLALLGAIPIIGLAVIADLLLRLISPPATPRATS